MIVNDVISAVRRRLGDVRKERWTDEQLILYTSLCQNDICIFTNFHRREGAIFLVDGKLKYSLPTDCIRVERLEYGGEFFPIESRNTIDDGTALLPCALKDNLAYNEIEIVLGDSYDTLHSALVSTYGVLVDSNTDAIDTSDCELMDDYGVLVDVDDTQAPSPDPLGYLKVYYSAVPALVEELTDELVLPDMWISAFIHYVCGAALQDDNDANNIQRGEMELQKYNRMLTQLFKTSAKDFTTNYKSKLTTKVRRI